MKAHRWFMTTEERADLITRRPVIQSWMGFKGIRVHQIAEATGIKSSTISRVIYTSFNQYKVLRWLLDQGCPLEDRHLPPALRAQKTKKQVAA